MTDLLSSLNEYQKQAVTTDNSAVLVLAGAGSGKTRVLIHRIAWCCQQGVMPHQFLALTFTNKAAAEMKVRIENLLPGFASNIWIGTFHGIAYRLLKMHWKQANLSQNFQIIDTDDQTQLIKRLVKEAKLSDDTDAKSIQWQINHYKDEGLRADYIESGFQDDPNVLLIYKRYEQLCQRSGLVDFAELLLRSLELFRQNPDLVAHYQDRFQHILVDEFQDTNSIQYAWIKLITGNNLFIVGDDDQSIYSWRGAKIENLTTFQSDFPQHEIIRLEQNYRSTNTILSAANAVIKFNQQRLGKDLWCEGAEGDLITVFKAMNEKDEAIYTIKEIKKLCSHGVSNRDIAILYRSNALSRNFEELLVSNGIAYRIYGGLRFFERAEIKDVLAYLKLIHNSDDDSSYIRIVNKPTRGIGQKAQSVVHELANEQSISLWEASVKVCEQGLLKAKAKSSLVNFIQLINDFKAMTESDSFSNLTNSIIEKTGLQAMHEKEHSEKAIMRIENIKEFLVAVKQFDSEHQQTDAVVEDFLSKVSLDAGVNGETSEQDSVNLMTLHSAKGLEFSYVFICGLEQGLFPHINSIMDNQLEEERRLFYVGMTRAKEKLHLTHACSRQRFGGRPTLQKASQFIEEIPSQYVISEKSHQQHFARTQYYEQKPKYKSIKSASAFELGQRVLHKKFGEGIILDHEGEGDRARVQVHFDAEGSKWLAVAYAKLETL